MLSDLPLTISSLIRAFLGRVCLTWALTLGETALMTLVPLFIGFAIDGLLGDDKAALMHLTILLAVLIVVSVIRRIYDTRAYGTIRVAVGKTLVERSAEVSISSLNARLGMGRELVDFLEERIPEVMKSAVQLTVSLIVLYAFHPMLSYAALTAAILMVVIYGAFHQRFFLLNADHNHQVEQQVGVLEKKSAPGIASHLQKLRRIEVKLSDTEAYVYGAIFAVLLGFIVFNLWFAAGNVEVSVGKIFSIISYSWEFVESALVLPVTLQGWSRLSEIMERINHKPAQSESAAF